MGGVPEPEPLLALWLGTVGGRVECASLGEEATGELAMTRQDKTRRDEARRGETEERRGKGERGDKGEKRGQRGKGEKQYYCISIRPPFRKAKGERRKAKGERRLSTRKGVRKVVKNRKPPITTTTTITTYNHYTVCNRITTIITATTGRFPSPL